GRGGGFATTPAWRRRAFPPTGARPGRGRRRRTARAGWSGGGGRRRTAAGASTGASGRPRGGNRVIIRPGRRGRGKCRAEPGLRREQPAYGGHSPQASAFRTTP